MKKKPFNKRLREVILALPDDKLEIFVRQRLGQADAVVNYHDYIENIDESFENGIDVRPFHERFVMHCDSPAAIINNMKILSLFEDLFNWGDHNHPPLIIGYKGCVFVTAFGSSDHFIGKGTVEIIKELIKRLPEEGSFNGMYYSILKHL